MLSAILFVGIMGTVLFVLSPFILILGYILVNAHRIDPAKVGALVNGHTDDPMAYNAKGGMIIRRNGSVDFQSSKK